MLKKFIQTILKGQEVLQKTLNSYLKIFDEDIDEKAAKETMQYYWCSYDDLQMISKPFKISFDHLPTK